MDFERCLPYDLKLESLFESDMQIFEQEIADVRAAHAGDDILDSDIEFDTPETLEYFYGIAEQLPGAFIDARNTSDDSHETRDAAYRAMVFAYQTCVEVHGSNTGLKAGTYFASLLENFKDPQCRFECDIHDYLAENPHVDAYIGLFADEIDEGRNQLPAIELAAGMVFMLIERRLGEKFVNSQADDLMPQDFESQ